MTRWYLRDASRRLSFGARHPVYSARVLLAELTLSDERFIASITKTHARGIRSILNEPQSDPRIAGLLEECRLLMRDGGSSRTSEPFAKKMLIPYAVARAVKPKVVVETGVSNGVSSMLLLHAMKRNKLGHLYSIDVGDPLTVPEGREVGWVVPPELRHRWTLRLGDSRELLPGLLEEVGEIDVFYHDSLHTFDHMSFEFSLALPALRSGGVLVADDATWNRAFTDLCAKREAAKARICHGVGVLKKAG